jgi:hypothetical protein
VKALRRLKKEIYRYPKETLLEKLFKANLTLTAHRSISDYRARGLEEVLKLEKKKRSRGKRLNLVGESDGGAQLFSPSRIICARDFQQQKLASIEAEKQAKAIEKTRNQEEKERKKLEATAKAIQKEMDRQITKEIKSTQKRAPKAKKALIKPAQKDTTGARKSTVRYKAVPKVSISSKEIIIEEGEEGSTIRSTRGCKITLPSRYKQ